MKYEEFLNPAITRERLISASVYIAAFESLKDVIVSKLKFFYCLEEFESKKPCEKYRSDILSRNSSPLYASLDWFLENEAIDKNDLEKFEEIKICRNNLSHNLFDLIGSCGLPPDYEMSFHNLVELMHKIDLWWVMNIEIPTNPAYDGEEINESDVQVGSVMALKM